MGELEKIPGETICERKEFQTGREWVWNKDHGNNKHSLTGR